MKFNHAVWPIAIALFLGYLALDFSKKQPYGFFRNPFWADKAGYYVFLPYVLQAEFDASALPDSVSQKTGFGFKLVNNKVQSKYPVGVAYMQAPFYLAALFIDAAQGEGALSNPFTGVYKKTLVLAAPFYVAIGLYLLFLSLRIFEVSRTLSIMMVLFCGFATSLFYYTVIEGLMSHSFSFALFAAFTFLWLKYLGGHESWRINIWLAVIIGLIIVVRPFNVLMLPCYAIALAAMRYKSFSIIIKPALQLAPLTIVVGAFLLMPQLLYYKHIYGSWLADSYQKEAFDFLNPQVLNVLFSPKAGQFIYVPAFFVIVLALLYQSFFQPRKYAFLLLFFAAITYVLSCWHSWTYGCGFGIRPFVEWLPLLILPLALLLKEKQKLLYVFVPIAVALGYYNYVMTYVWSGCWFGKEETFTEFFSMFWT